MKPLLALAFLSLIIFGCFKTFYIPENPTIGEVVTALQPKPVEANKTVMKSNGFLPRDAHMESALTGTVSKCSDGSWPREYTFTNCWNKDMVRGTSFGYWTAEDLPKLVARQKKEDPTWECAPFSYDRSICPEELK